MRNLFSSPSAAAAASFSQQQMQQMHHQMMQHHQQQLHQQQQQQLQQHHQEMQVGAQRAQGACRVSHLVADLAWGHADLGGSNTLPGQQVSTAASCLPDARTVGTSQREAFTDQNGHPVRCRTGKQMFSLTLPSYDESAAKNMDVEAKVNIKNAHRSSVQPTIISQMGKILFNTRT